VPCSLLPSRFTSAHPWNLSNYFVLTVWLFIMLAVLWSQCAMPGSVIFLCTGSGLLIVINRPENIMAGECIVEWAELLNP
jgi:hypothetical protein